MGGTACSVKVSGTDTTIRSADRTGDLAGFAAARTAVAPRAVRLRARMAPGVSALQARRACLSDSAVHIRILDRRILRSGRETLLKLPRNPSFLPRNQAEFGFFLLRQE